MLRIAGLAQLGEGYAPPHGCAVFGHEGLYVVDGAVVPRPIGLNPSKTIAALAERACALLLEER